jgi:acyl-homoserine-lactone acylase
LWDSWGVPHIYASSRDSAFYQLGWAQMSAHADRIAALYGTARGEGAAHWGAHAYDEDALVWSLRIPERAREWLEQQSPDYRRYLEAFTRGLNDYAAEHPKAVAPRNRWTLPFRAVDVLAHVQRILLTRFLFSDAGAIVAWRSGAVQSNELRPEKAQQGSNGYAIAPSRSADKRAMLLINPHLPWSGDLTLFEAQIVEGDSYVYGAALVGQPYLSMAFTPHAGWTHTVNGFDGLDTYELTLRDGGYEFDGQPRAFEQADVVQIDVRTAGGKRVRRTLPRASSVHGPLVAIDPARGKALALRFTGVEASGLSANGQHTDSSQLVQRYWELADSRTVEQFEAVSTRYPLPSFNTLYANRRGDILFRYEGRMPRRSGGDYDSWQGIQPGHASANLWTSYYGAEALPRVLNPASGFVQNANDPPWFASYPAPLDPAQYPPYIARPLLDFRAQHSLRTVVADSSISFDELVLAQLSNRVELAERVLPALLQAVAGEPKLALAAQVLAGWDRTLAAEARGAVLFLSWVEEMGGAEGDWFGQPWQRSEPLATPRGLADLDAARCALARAAQHTRARHGRLDVRYGDVYRLRLAAHDLPASTGPVAYGTYSAAEFAPDRAQTRRAWGGDTFVAVVSFGPTVRAVGLLTYGNASQPGSPHLGDQLRLFSARTLRPLWLSRAEVEQNLERREQPGKLRPQASPARVLESRHE